MGYGQTSFLHCLRSDVLQLDLLFARVFSLKLLGNCWESYTNSDTNSYTYAYANSDTYTNSDF